MTEIEKIKRYIERTKMGEGNYYLNFGEACAMAKEARTSNAVMETIALAFNYGKAKGYRAAKAEVRMGKTLTFSGKSAVKMEEAIKVVRSKCPEFFWMTDNEVFNLLITQAIEKEAI